MKQMIIDFHSHCFPKKIAELAVSQLALKTGSIPEHDGTPESLKKRTREGGADKAVVLNIATNPKQQRNVNDFAISMICDDTLIPFGSVHPDSPDALDELERIHEAGIKGIKLHPDYQRFFINEKRMFPIYKKAAQLGLITQFHCGYDLGIPDPLHCAPAMMKEILPVFDGAPVVAAHFGGYMCWQEVLDVLVGEDVYIDTSFAYGRIPRDWARSIIEAHTPEKMLFGTDMPWSSTEESLHFIRTLGFSDSDTKKILGTNAQRLLGI